MSSDQESVSDDSSVYNFNNENIEYLSDSSSEPEFGDESTESNNTSDPETDTSESDDESLSGYYTDGENPDEDEIIAEYYYEPEEISRTKYNIVLCELYNLKKHGIPDLNSGVEYHYMIRNRYKKFNANLCEYDCSGYHDWIMEQFNTIIPHNIFRNYENIISREDYFKPEIAECLYLSGGECVAILKTFWIRIIQKKWKKILLERKEKIKLRKQIKSILYRETTGKWPSTCLYLPSLKGMLSELI